MTRCGKLMPAAPPIVSRTLRSPRLSLVAACPAPAGRAASHARQQRGGGLQLTRAADYAVRALIHLALQPPGTRLSQVDIAAAIGAPAPFVGKVMQQLASAGLVMSQRGIGGGFALHPTAGAATMLDAVTAIEGPLALNSCLSPDEACGRMSFCPAHHVWHEAQVRVEEVLRSATIGALAEQAAALGAQAGATSDGACQDRPGEPGEDSEAREHAVRSPRAQARGDDGSTPRPRGRDAAGAPDRSRGTGECHR